MSCPELDALQAVYVDGIGDPEVEAHVDECPDCRDLVAMAVDLADVFDPGLEVPPDLVARTIAASRERAAAPQRAPRPVAAVFASGALVALATLIWLLATADPTPGTFGNLILFSLMVGLGAGILSGRVAFRAQTLT